jgi:hypothetical protein
LNDDANSQPAPRVEALRAALAAKVAQIEGKRARITVASYRDQMHAAHAAYERALHGDRP